MSPVGMASRKFGYLAARVLLAGLLGVTAGRPAGQDGRAPVRDGAAAARAIFGKPDLAKTIQAAMPARPELHEFLLDHLPVAVAAARGLGCTSYTVRPRAGGGFELTDPWGLTGWFEEALRVETSDGWNERVYVGEGSKHGLWFGPVSGAMAVSIRYRQEAGGIMEHQVRVAVQVKGLANVVARLFRHRIERYLESRLHGAAAQAQAFCVKVTASPGSALASLREAQALEPADLAEFEKAIRR